MKKRRSVFSLTISKLIYGMCLIFFLCFAFTAGAQQVEGTWWFSLEKGKRYFRNGEFGNALMCFEDARRERREMYTGMERDMIELLSLPEVRRLGDRLEQVEAYIKDRYQPKAERVLREVYYRIPRENLNSSVNGILEELKRLKEYPEAEYWIGEVYRVEGELGLALSQYQKAYAKREFLENSSFDVDILYKILDIYRMRYQYIELEKHAEEIFKHDTLSFDNGQGPFAWVNVNRMLNRNDEDRRGVISARNYNEVHNIDMSDAGGINQFLNIYRYNNKATERAHRLLGFQYIEDRRHDKAAEHLLFSFLIQNTVIIEELIRLQSDFTFTTLDNLLVEIQKRPQLQSYIDDVDYFKTIYELGVGYYASGGHVTALRLWYFLTRHPETGEWGVRSQKALLDPAGFVLGGNFNRS
ncbi:MAG: hypothetical protein LBQ88_00870 [Treponema sp.]|jgi:tetratricopeptide (TPR) repeat protein|nr:hypothetical protein [Treponema sp.]